MLFLKKIIIAATLFVIVLSSAMVFARITHTLLVFDVHNSQEMPERFRSTNDALSTKNLNLAGLQELRAAGSAQFSEMGLQSALNRIPSRSVIIVDLRRESHGYLNGDAVSWYGPQNAANLHKTSGEIAKSEARLLGRLQQSKVRSVAEIIKKTKDAFIKKVNRKLVVVRSVMSEKQLAESLGMSYQRFYVDDHHAPRDEDVNRYVAFLKTLPPETWLYFHCRGGRGRTSAFMAMYDMIKNAKILTFDEIVDRQTALGGTNLSELPPADSYKYQFAYDRLSFLKHFYQYARSNNDDFATSWTEWKASR